MATAILIGWLAVQGSVSVAGAATTSCGSTTPNNWQQGHRVDRSLRVVSAQADIVTRKADFCINNANTISYAWVMVFAGYQGGANGWAQIGYTHKDADWGAVPWRFFWQWTKDGSPYYTAYWGSPTLGVSHNYRVFRSSTDGHLHLYFNGSAAPPNSSGIDAETDFDPLTAWNDGVAAFDGEVNWSGSDVPGITLSRK